MFRDAFLRGVVILSGLRVFFPRCLLKALVVGGRAATAWYGIAIEVVGTACTGFVLLLAADGLLVMFCFP